MMLIYGRHGLQLTTQQEGGRNASRWALVRGSQPPVYALEEDSGTLSLHLVLPVCWWL